jgi:protein-disulfide isomerase
MLSAVQRNRLVLLAGAVVIAAAVVAVVVIAGGGKGADTSTTTGSISTSTTSDSFAYLKGVPQHGDALGAPSAPATLVVYEDPQCPFCRDWALGALPSVVTDYVRTGKLKLVYRGVEVIGPNSQKGLRAIYAAAKQNKLWNLADALYRRQGAENSGWITDAVIRSAAKAAGANADAILIASSSVTVTADLRQAATSAGNDAVQGTPTFVLERPPAVSKELQVTALDPVTFETALAQALQ